MNTTSISLIYLTKPDLRYGIGGVRSFLTSFSEYALSNGIECQYYTIREKHRNFGRLTPVYNTLLTIRLLMKLLASQRGKKKMNILYAHEAFYSGVVALVASRILHIPSILHYHNSTSVGYLIVNSQNHFIARVGYHVIRLVERYILSRSDHIIVTNSALERMIANFGISQDKITSLPMAILTEKFVADPKESEEVVRELGMTRRPFVIGYVGRLSVVKDLRVLITAYSLFVEEISNTDTRLILVGDGSEMESLKNLADSLKIRNNVVFAGLRYDIPRLLNFFDVFVLPSKTEGSPIALLEAMAAGRAIVASNISAVCEVVEDNKQAILFDPSKPQELKDIICRMYNDEELRMRLGENAKKKAKEYDVNVVFPRIVEIFRKISKGSSSSTQKEGALT